jgi:hypothetical protein
MLNSGKKISSLRDKKKNSNSCVVRKKILNETKNHNPTPPFQVEWSVPKYHASLYLRHEYFFLFYFYLQV